MTLTPPELQSLRETGRCTAVREMEPQPPVCPDCGGIGVVDSGAPDEQGKFIDLPCWCHSCTNIKRFFTIPKRLLPEEPERLVPTHIQDAYASVKWEGWPWSGHEVLASEHAFIPPLKVGDRIDCGVVKSVRPVKRDKWVWEMEIGRE